MANETANPPPPPPHPHGGRREYAIDPLRGVVCLSIVVMHLFTGSVLAGQTRALGDWAVFAVSHVRLGYESFFLISGFFLAHSYRPPAGQYLSVPRLTVRRFLRLAVPYWVAVALGYSGFLGRQLLGLPTRLPSWPDVLAQVLFVPDLVGEVELVSIVFWSMGTLLQFYILWATAFWVVRQAYLDPDGAYLVRTERAMIGLTAAAGVASAVVVVASPEWRWQLPRNAVYFAAGCFVYWGTHGRIARRWVVVTVVFLAALGVALLHSRLIAAAVTSVVLTWLTGRGKFPDYAPVRWLAAVGERSYSIYLTHSMVGARVLHLSDHFREGQTPTHIAALILLGAVAAALAFGFVFYQLVEVPVRRLSGLIVYRK